MKRYPLIETPEYFLRLPYQDRRLWKLKDAQKFSIWLQETIPQRSRHLEDFAEDNSVRLELSEESFNGLIDVAVSSGDFTEIYSDGKLVLNIYGISFFTDIYLYLVGNLMLNCVGLVEIEPYRIRKTDLFQNMPTLKVCGRLTEYHIFHRVSMLALGIIRYGKPNSIFYWEFEKIRLEIEKCRNRN